LNTRKEIINFELLIDKIFFTRKERFCWSI